MGPGETERTDFSPLILIGLEGRKQWVLVVVELSAIVFFEFFQGTFKHSNNYANHFHNG